MSETAPRLFDPVLARRNLTRAQAEPSLFLAGAVADEERAVCGGRGDGKISAFGNCFRVEIVDRFNFRFIIDRQWRLQKRAPGKSD